MNFFQKKIIQKESDFFQFLNNCADFSDQECLLVEQKIKDKNTKRIIHVFFVLLVWSGFAAIIDAVLFSSSLVMSLVNNSFEFLYFLIFFLVNILLKIWYISTAIPMLNWYEKIIASLPYVGGGYLLAHALKKDALLRKALWRFLKN